MPPLGVSGPFWSDETSAPNASQLAEHFHPYVLEATGEAQDDSGNMFQLFSQILSLPSNLYLPPVLRQ